MSAPETSIELSENQLFDFSISIAGRITKLHLDLHKTIVLSDTVCTAECSNSYKRCITTNSLQYNAACQQRNACTIL